MNDRPVPAPAYGEVSSGARGARAGHVSEISCLGIPAEVGRGPLWRGLNTGLPQPGWTRGTRQQLAKGRPNEKAETQG